MLLSGGQGVPKDEPRAREIFAKACKEGEAQGCYYLGLMFSEGKGGPKDKARANEFFEQACKGGITDACDVLKAENSSKAQKTIKKDAKQNEKALEKLEQRTRRSKLPDQAQVINKGQLRKYASAATESCSRQYSDPDFCRCMVKKLNSIGLKQTEWIAVGEDFSSLAKIASKYKGLRTTLRSCLQ